MLSIVLAKDMQLMTYNPYSTSPAQFTWLATSCPHFLPEDPVDMGTRPT